MRRQLEGARPGLPLAGRKIEVGPELPPLDVPPLPEEGEAPRLEQVAEVDFGQEAGVTLVPGPLEAVDGEGLEGVDGRDLIDDENPPAEPGHAAELRDDELGPVDVMQCSQRAGEIE